MTSGKALATSLLDNDDSPSLVSSSPTSLIYPPQCFQSDISKTRRPQFNILQRLLRTKPKLFSLLVRTFSFANIRNQLEEAQIKNEQNDLLVGYWEKFLAEKNRKNWAVPGIPGVREGAFTMG